MRISRIWMCLFAGIVSLSALGCGDVLHNLQRHRLDRLNRVPDYMPSDAYNFSIPDPPLPAEKTETSTTPPPAKCSSNICPE